MKSFNSTLILMVGALALASEGVPALGQGPVIASFGRNGELVCTNLEPGTVAAIEWASTVTGPWTNSWAGLTTLAVDSNGTIRASVPMFYRVWGAPRNPDPGKLVWIAPGTFTMGCPDSEAERSSADGPQTQVTITRGFWMGRYEVTQSEYLAVMGVNPSSFTGDLNRPVETVSWNDAVAYCAALTARERAAGRLPSGFAYRLPTDAEWEYACRAGTTTAFHYGPALRSGKANFNGVMEYDSSVGTINNPSGTYLDRTTTVGTYTANSWGLYDMHGNAWEWCQDWWTSSLPGGSVTDPQGPSTGTDRVLRGGGWGSRARNCRSAFRSRYSPGYGISDFGFRVVVASSQP